MDSIDYYLSMFGKSCWENLSPFKLNEIQGCTTPRHPFLFRSLPFLFPFLIHMNNIIIYLNAERFLEKKRKHSNLPANNEN